MVLPWIMGARGLVHEQSLHFTLKFLDTHHKPKSSFVQESVHAFVGALACMHRLRFFPSLQNRTFHTDDPSPTRRLSRTRLAIFGEKNLISTFQSLSKILPFKRWWLERVHWQEVWRNKLQLDEPVLLLLWYVQEHAFGQVLGHPFCKRHDVYVSVTLCLCICLCEHAYVAAAQKPGFTRCCHVAVTTASLWLAFFGWQSHSPRTVARLHRCWPYLRLCSQSTSVQLCTTTTSAHLSTATDESVMTWPVALRFQRNAATSTVNCQCCSDEWLK